MDTVRLQRYDGPKFWADGNWWAGIGGFFNDLLNGTAGLIVAKNGNYPNNSSEAYIQGSYDTSSNVNKYLIYGGVALILIILIVLLVSRK